MSFDQCYLTSRCGRAAESAGPAERSRACAKNTVVLREKETSADAARKRRRGGRRRGEAALQPSRGPRPPEEAARGGAPRGNPPARVPAGAEQKRKIPPPSKKARGADARRYTAESAAFWGGAVFGSNGGRAQRPRGQSLGASALRVVRKPRRVPWSTLSPDGTF